MGARSAIIRAAHDQATKKFALAVLHRKEFLMFSDGFCSIVSKARGTLLENSPQSVGVARTRTEESMQAKSVRLGMARGFIRAAAVAFVFLSFDVRPIGPAELGFRGLSSLSIAFAAPAHARCLIGGAIRNDIADGDDCLEAQRTGCVRRMLTADQYRACLQANRATIDSGSTCIIGGVVRNDLSPVDCEEAKATGCVRGLLTSTQYRACLDAQRR